MTERSRPKAKGFRRFERWLVGVAFALLAFVLEKVVLRSVKRKGVEAEPAEEVTTMISKGGEVDVDL
jgi:hypothetical protein